MGTHIKLTRTKGYIAPPNKRTEETVIVAIKSIATVTPLKVERRITDDSYDLESVHLSKVYFTRPPTGNKEDAGFVAPESPEAIFALIKQAQK